MQMTLARDQAHLYSSCIGSGGSSTGAAEAAAEATAAAAAPSQWQQQWQLADCTWRLQIDLEILAGQHHVVYTDAGWRISRTCPVTQGRIDRSLHSALVEGAAQCITHPLGSSMWQSQQLRHTRAAAVVTALTDIEDGIPLVI